MLDSAASLLFSPAFQLLAGLAVLLGLVSCVTKPPSSPYKHWAVYYGSDAAPEEFKGYDLVVLDADRHPDIDAIKAQGSQVLAYISASEIDSGRKYFKQFLEQLDIGIGVNEAWQSHVIDLRQQQWQDFIVGEWLDADMAKGFDGVFIDTLDTAISYEQNDPQYQGMKLAAIQVIQRLRENMPEGKLLMVNRGFEILPDIAGDIDIVLAESILVDAGKSGSPFFPAHIYKNYTHRLQMLRQKYSHLSIFTLDYPETIDKTTQLRICRAQRTKGFIPYVSTKDLQHVTPLFPGC